MSNQEKHNGYKNYDTWKVAVWLFNDETNYKALMNLNRENIKNINKGILQRHFVYTNEEINWDNVDVKEIIDLIEEMFDDLEEEKEWQTLL